MGGSGALGGCGEAIRRLWGPWEHLGRYVSVGRVWGLWAYRKGGVGRLEGGCGALESCVALRKGSKFALGPAPHASISLAMAVCICVGRGVCVAMVVLRRKTRFVFFTVVWGHPGEKALFFMAQFPWAKAALAAEVWCQEA